MANYKPFGKVSVGKSNVHHIDQAQLVKVLTHPFALSAAAKSLKAPGTSAYRVPTDKTFHGVEIQIEHNQATNTQVDVYEGTTVNGLDTFLHRFYTVSSNLKSHSYPCAFDIASNNWCTVNPGSTNVHYVLILGYET